MVIFSTVAFKIILLFLLSVCGYLWLSRIGRKSLFPFFFLFLLIISAYVFLEAEKEPPIVTSPGEKRQLLLDQTLFIDWYTAYKKDIDRIDANWQQYHKTLKMFNNDEISIETVQSRLAELQQKTKEMKDKYEQMKPPEKLSQTNADLTCAIIDKTGNFTVQQDSVLIQTLRAIHDRDFKRIPHGEQVTRLEKIMILENPINLDIATEVLQIRDNLTLQHEE